MFARVNAVFGERQDAHVVPEEALVPQGQRQFVMLLQPTPGDAQAWTTKRVEVKVGVRRPGQVEVVGELQPGDMVVCLGAGDITKWAGGLEAGIRVLRSGG